MDNWLQTDLACSIFIPGHILLATFRQKVLDYRDFCSYPVKLFLQHSFFLYGIGQWNESDLHPNPHKLLMLDFFLHRLFVFGVILFLLVRTNYLKIIKQLTVHLEMNKCAGFIFHKHRIFSTTMKFADLVNN